MMVPNTSAMVRPSATAAKVAPVAARKAGSTITRGIAKTTVVGLAT
jgi:hypothetical protein